MIKLFFISILLLMQNLSLAQEQPTIIYIGDPMCSWCYGFAPELSKTIDHFDNKANLRLVMGGLRPYNDEHIDTMKDFLTDHWKHVHEASGQYFDYGILDDPDFIYDTEPPSRAVLVVRHMKPEVEMNFFKDVQEMFYAKNQHTDRAENYYPLLDKYELDRAVFVKSFNSDEMKSLIKQDFSSASEMNIRGFPSMVLFQDGKYTLLSNGYSKSEVLIEKIEKLIE
jgi:putative protein-disulfide isomerase